MTKIQTREHTYSYGMLASLCASVTSLLWLLWRLLLMLMPMHLNVSKFSRMNLVLGTVGAES